MKETSTRGTVRRSHVDFRFKISGLRFKIGLIRVQEKESQSVSKVICWFSRELATEFSKIKGDQYLTVRGLFNGERGRGIEVLQAARYD